MSKTITLTKPWGDHEEGARLRVWEPGDPITPSTVDPQRAQQLEADGYLAEKPVKKPAAAKARRGRE